MLSKCYVLNKLMKQNYYWKQKNWLKIFGPSLRAVWEKNFHTYYWYSLPYLKFTSKIVHTPWNFPMVIFEIMKDTFLVTFLSLMTCKKNAFL